MMERVIMTKEGNDSLREELKLLKSVERRKIIKAIAKAREFGDLKENAEYHAAREQQAQIESKIIEINDLVARANVIDVTKLEKSDKVVFGSTVELLDLENNVKKIYKIVGKTEADAQHNLIYFRSPIGKALIGKNKKDHVIVKTPSGEKNFEIVNVKYI